MVGKRRNMITYFSNPLLMLSSKENRPCYPTRILPLQEKRFGLAVLESEDFAVATDVEFALLVGNEYVSMKPFVLLLLVLLL